MKSQDNEVAVKREQGYTPLERTWPEFSCSKSSEVVSEEEAEPTRVMLRRLARIAAAATVNRCFAAFGVGISRGEKHLNF